MGDPHENPTGESELTDSAAGAAPIQSVEWGVLRYLAHELAGPVGQLGSLLALSEQLLAECVGSLRPQAPDEARQIESKVADVRTGRLDALERTRAFLTSAQFLNVADGEVELHLTKVALSPVIDDAWHRLSSHRLPASGRAPQPRLTIVGQRDAFVVADRNLIAMAIENLLDNALKFGSVDTVEVGLQASATHCRVSVRNRGPGINAEDRAQLFEPFSRVQRRGRTQPGLGLGLYVTRHVAEAHGGTADLVSSTPIANGSGAITEFEIRLPTNLSLGSRTAIFG